MAMTEPGPPAIEVRGLRKSYDGVERVHAIDFSVAKAMEQKGLTELTLLTQFEQMIGTPLYMSPE